MSAIPFSFRRDGDDELLARIARALETRGYIVLSGVFPEETLSSLFIHFKSLDARQFAQAGIGREQQLQKNPFVRSDQTCWLNPGHPATQTYFHWTEQLRMGLNRHLFLGLRDYECHFAYYPQGAFYKKHLDAFRGDNCRVISSVLYLNPNWAPQDGGELLLYAPTRDGTLEKIELLEKVEPGYGRMVLFLSEDFPHEVLTANKPRYSLTGWFRTGVQIQSPVLSEAS
ncbi:MAG: 2OG-Fe(II) oxygenase [Pseudomonadales bacterium]|nr:2OG-Fe(II) oxygenase [Pseudomonadales bacterium]